LTEVVNFLPATPKATYELLDYYGIGDLQGKVVTMIGQSNLMGKPFVVEAMRRRATVFTTNSTTSLSLLKDICKKSDYIIAATGVV
jgi:methylenetetrahydrofolate dehydrogenase (NADP+)/methenyltetrahydrofolate cyclohydrolase